MFILGLIVTVLYVLDMTLVSYYGLRNYLVVYLFWRKKEHCRSDLSIHNVLREKFFNLAPEDYPIVTIQLPIFNELYVAQRVVESTIAINYPKDKLEIQVLDDSIDETKELLEKLVKKYQKQNYNITHIHRLERTGHKAGALENGLQSCKGNYIAIFDADFIPSQGFILDTLPFLLFKPEVGLVQTRWEHLNRSTSLLTQAQSIGIDGHFILEKGMRNSYDLWINFSGTAGIWKKKAIIDAGGWSADTLTEDMDISYRAQLKGWKFLYFYDIASPCELPSTISGFKTQQFRWCKGSMQTGIKLIKPILRSSESWKRKLESMNHLFYYSVHPLMVLNVLLVYPFSLFVDTYFVSYKFSTFSYVFLGIILLTTISPSVFYLSSQYFLYKNWRSRIRFIFGLTMIGSGIALSNTRAWIEAVIGKKSPFVRTPKEGDQKIGLTSSKSVNNYNRKKLDKTAFLEITLGMYLAFVIENLFRSELYMIIPFIFLFMLGSFYVGILSILEWYMFSQKKENVS